MLTKIVNLCIHTHLYYRLLNVLHMCETKLICLNETLIFGDLISILVSKLVFDVVNNTFMKK